MADFEDYYDILQVSPSAEPEVIEAAFKKLAQKYHPDVNKSPSATEEKMKKINIAHDILSHPDKRMEYDKEWQKHKVGGTGPREPSQSKTAQNNTHTGGPKEDRSKPQSRLYERVAIIILVIAVICLLFKFVLIPRYPWLKVALPVLFVILAICVAKFPSFRHVLSESIKSILAWVTGRDLKEKVEGTWLPKWTWHPADMVDKLAFDVWDLILNFRPKRHYDYEDGYHKELYAYLKKKFPQKTELKPTRGASQADIGIDNIGIEVKGPTRNSDLKSIPDKLLTYEQHWSPIFVVLFDPKFGEGLTEGCFSERKAGIKRRHPNVGVITKPG